MIHFPFITFSLFYACCEYLIDCLLMLMACVSSYQRESSANEDSENDDKVKLLTVCVSMT